MSTITDEEYSALVKLAKEIKDETKSQNALALLDRMRLVIEGAGDKVISWMPTPIKVLQALSNMDNISAKNPKDVAAGALVAGSTHMPNGTEVIPLMFWSSRSLWDPDQNNNRKLCSSPDAKFGWAHGECSKCPYSRSEEGVPPCNKEQTFLIMARDLSDMYRVSFHKSQYRSGLDWGKDIQNSRTFPFKRVYGLSGESLEKNKKIKTIKATLLDVRDNSIPEDELAFLEAMYKKQLNDRKGYLEMYRQQVQDRQDKKGHIAISHDGEQAPVAAIEHDDGTPNYSL